MRCVHPNKWLYNIFQYHNMFVRESLSVYSPLSDGGRGVDYEEYCYYWNRVLRPDGSYPTMSSMDSLI